MNKNVISCSLFKVMLLEVREQTFDSLSLRKITKITKNKHMGKLEKQKMTILINIVIHSITKQGVSKILCPITRAHN